MFVGGRNQKPRGEQDYGNKSLATGIYPKSHLCSEVVYMVLAVVKVQGVQHLFVLSWFTKVRTVFVYVHEKHICAQQTKRRFCMSLFGDGQDSIS